jgi:hypothetical protein
MIKTFKPGKKINPVVVIVELTRLLTEALVNII